MSDLDGGKKEEPGRRRGAKNDFDLTTRVVVVTPTGALTVGAKSSAPIDPPRPRKRHTYQLIAPADRRGLTTRAKISPVAFAGFIDQVELAVFEWQSARERQNVYLNEDVQKILSSLATTLRLLDRHYRLALIGSSKDEASELMRQHHRKEEALRPILELICPGWADSPRPDFRRALGVIKATSGIGVKGPKHQGDPHDVAAAERIALAWRKYSKLPLSSGSDENSPRGYLTALLSEINIYEPHGLVPGGPKRMPRAVLAAFLEQVVNRELTLTIDRLRKEAG